MQKVGSLILRVLIEPASSPFAWPGAFRFGHFGVLLGALGRVEVGLAVGDVAFEAGRAGVDEDHVAGEVEQVGRSSEDPLGDVGQGREQEAHRRVSGVIVEVRTVTESDALTRPAHRG